MMFYCRGDEPGSKYQARGCKSLGHQDLIRETGVPLSLCGRSPRLPSCPHLCPYRFAGQRRSQGLPAVTSGAPGAKAGSKSKARPPEPAPIPGAPGSLAFPLSAFRIPRLTVPQSPRHTVTQSPSPAVTGRQTLFLCQMRDFPPPAVARRAEEGSQILPLHPWRTLRLNYAWTRRYTFQGETPPLPPSPRLWRTGAVGVTPGDACPPPFVIRPSDLIRHSARHSPGLSGRRRVGPSAFAEACPSSRRASADKSDFVIP